MCWTLQVSLLFGVVGLVLAGCVDRFWHHKTARCGALVLAYFAVMEFIQAAQHFVLAIDADPITTCARRDNQVFTVLAIAHVCFQPVMLHWYYYRCGTVSTGILKMVWIGCLMDTSAYVYGNIANPALALQQVPAPAPAHSYDWEACRGGQWLAGANLCTTMGQAHLAWSTPLPVPSYEYHGPLHSFVWFAPFLCGNGYFALEGLSMYVIGPVFSRWWVRSKGDGNTPIDQREVGSTWCFLQFGVFVVIFANGVFRIFLSKRSKRNNNNKQPTKKQEAIHNNNNNNNNIQQLKSKSS